MDKMRAHIQSAPVWETAACCVDVCSCSESICWFRHEKCCSVLYQMREHLIAFPQILTCSASPHSARLIFNLLTYLFLRTISFLAFFLFSFCLSFVYILMFLPTLSGSPSWSSGEGIHVPVLRTSVGPCRAPALPPVPVLPAWMSSYSAAWTALVSLFSPPCLHVSPKFVMCLCSLSQPGYINEGGGREREKGEMQAERNWGGGTKGSLIQSSFVPLGCRGQLTVPRQCETIQISLLCLTAVSLLSFGTSSESQTICAHT